MSEEMKPCPFCGGRFGHHKDRCYVNLLHDWTLDNNSVDTHSLHLAWNARAEPTEQAAKQMIPRVEVERFVKLIGKRKADNLNSNVSFAILSTLESIGKKLLKETE